MKQIIRAVLMGLVFLSCHQQESKEDNIMSNESKQFLTVLQSHRIYFGHQSVGQNIIAGIQDILSLHPGIRINLIKTDQLSAAPDSFYFAHSFIGKNEKPYTKCDDFYNQVFNKLSANLDLALMKFCYIDFNENSDVSGLFNYYTDKIKILQSKYPDLKIVHMTVPLEAKTPQWKLLIKKLLGRKDMTAVLNLKREEYNNLLRKTYDPNFIFDLAYVESAYPDGRREMHQMDGNSYYSLIESYTDDGSHLNQTGRKVVAAAMLKTLAAVLGQ